MPTNNVVSNAQYKAVKAGVCSSAFTLTKVGFKKTLIFLAVRVGLVNYDWSRKIITAIMNKLNLGGV